MSLSVNTSEQMHTVYVKKDPDGLCLSYASKVDDTGLSRTQCCCPSVPLLSSHRSGAAHMPPMCL